MKNENQNKKLSHKSFSLICLGFVALVAVAALFVTGLVRYIQFNKITEASPLTIAEANALDLQLKNKYSQNYGILKPLPYDVSGKKLELGAGSAILVDVSNGNILYEKNADAVIPPASMTKLFAMYVVEEEVRAGRFSYDDVIYLPPESWACNMPPHSSLMFLGEDQKVTLRELLLGLSICSGNDAAYALAYAVCGNMEDFVSRMNQVAVELGLSHTHFVESSGYSELNTTTAREMAAFARMYIKNHPDSLRQFHSVKSFTYPQKHNLAPGDILEAQDFTQGLPSHITMSITQMNTNPLLGKLEGCDGLKTGYIDESGYNLSLTAVRGNNRYLSVTMRGPGNSTKEGQEWRVKDGTTLMEYGFRNFTDLDVSGFVKPYVVKVYGAKSKAVNLVPAYSVITETVPFVTGNSITESLESAQIDISLPAGLFGDVVGGYEYGSVTIRAGDYVIHQIPLVADRNVDDANFVVKLLDSVYCNMNNK